MKVSDWIRGLNATIEAHGDVELKVEVWVGDFDRFRVTEIHESGKQIILKAEPLRVRH